MESLGLDIKLLVAQIVNFAILFFVLKKVLYKPLIKVIDDRNKKIAESLENSQKIETKLAKIEEKEIEIMNRARDKAKKEREELLVLADSEKNQIIDEAKSAAKREVEKGLESIKAAEAEAVKSITEKYIADITEKLQQKLTANAKSSGYPVIKKLIK
jgi:F-type H+-transporting ATPase subunit b